MFFSYFGSKLVLEFYSYDVNNPNKREIGYNTNEKIFFHQTRVVKTNNKSIGHDYLMSLQILRVNTE